MADNLSNDAFNDALNRARQLAAKIGSGEKRPLEDGEGNAPKRMNSDMNGTAIPAMGNGSGGPPPAGNGQNLDLVVVEQYKVPDSMVGLIIGRGGEQINTIQAQTQCRVQMAQDSAGMPDRVCTLTGTKEAVRRAMELIGQIIAKGNNMGNQPPPNPAAPGSVIEEMLIPGPKVGLVIGKGGENLKQIQAQLGVRMIVIQDTNQSGMHDKPLRIIGPHDKVMMAKNMVQEQMNSKDDSPGTFGGGGGGFHPGPKSLGEVIVPRIAVGVIIGKNGEMIKKLQNESGARVQFKINEDANAAERTAILTGAAEQIEKATQMITDLVRQAMQKQGGGGGMGGGGPSFGGGRQEVFYMHVPSTKTGLVIGKGGETIRQINMDSGAHVELSREAPPNDFEKIFIIRGTPQAIHHAQHLIRIKVGDILPNTPLPPFQSTQQYQPAAPAAAPAPAGYPYPNPAAAAPGPQVNQDPQAAWQAYYAYYQQAYQQGAAGAPAATPAAQPQAQPVSAAAAQPAAATQSTPAPTVNPITGQPDYSAAWAEYYRSLGMHEQANMIEQQAKANQAAAVQQQAAVSQPQPQASYTAYPQQQPAYNYPGQTQYPQQF